MEEANKLDQQFNWNDLKDKKKNSSIKPSVIKRKKKNSSIKPSVIKRQKKTLP
jgi:hypothetical protein